MLVLYCIIASRWHVKHKWMSISMFSDAEQMTKRNFDLTKLSCHVNYAAFTRKLLASDMWMTSDDLWIQRRRFSAVDFIHRNRNLGVDWFAGFLVTFHQLFWRILLNISLSDFQFSWISMSQSAHWYAKPVANRLPAAMFVLNLQPCCAYCKFVAFGTRELKK